jgi:uncharacterized membrane protein
VTLESIVHSYRYAVGRLRHPVNIALRANAPLGVRVANRVTGFMGSWTFIVVQTIVVVIWIAGNVYLVFHFDPYPFILLNLAFSTQAAYAAPLILLASNQAAVRDRATLEYAAREAAEADRKDDDVRERLERIEALLRSMVNEDEGRSAPDARAVGGLPPGGPRGVGVEADAAVGLPAPRA